MRVSRVVHKRKDDTLFTDENCWKQGKADRFGWLIDGANCFRALRDSPIVVDARHPLAGEALSFDIELAEIV